ncbi:MAG: hypothetical protein U0U46_01505 [Saprospiraceae bacterium]
MRSSLFLILLLALCSCGNEIPEGQQLTVCVGKIAVREQAGEKSRALRTVSAGENLVALGRVSNFISAIRLGDSLLQAPWIEVSGKGLPSGWVFAAAVRPRGADFDEWFLQQQMRCFWGADLAERRNKWLAARSALKTADDAAAYYRETVALRDACMARLSSRSEPNEADVDPDFFWLNKALPGCITQRGSGKNEVFSFIDYHVWQQIAGSTAGNQDDIFINFCLTEFPLDSIESPYPSWTIQTAEKEGSSRLGSGKHLDMLQLIEDGLVISPLFTKEYLACKKLIMNDILNQGNTYWLPADKIRGEIDQIAARGFKCLDERDLLALQERRKQFDDPAANGIRVNLRAGE